MPRETKEGAGILLGCIKELKPVLARKGSVDPEAMTIDIFVHIPQILMCKYFVNF